MGRDTETSALVRCDAYPPDWSPREGPSEFAHWLLHTEQSRPGRYTVADGPGGRQVVWTGGVSTHCPAPYGWHVIQDKRPGRWLMRGAPQMPLEERQSAAPWTWAN